MKRFGLIGSTTELFRICMALPAGHCIDVPGELVRNATSEDELGANPAYMASTPSERQVREFVQKISENWEVTITDRFTRDGHTIYKRYPA